MKTLFFSFFWGCQEKTEIPVDTQIEDAQITATTDTAIVDTGDTEDTSETADTGGIVDTADSGGPVDTGSSPNPVMDFSKVNVNPNSASFGISGSPRDYMQQISGWYFIKAT